MAKTKRLWYEAQLFIGAAGSTAATQLLSRVNFGEEFNPDWVDVTTAEAGTSVPFKDQAIVQNDATVSFSLEYDTSEAAIETLLGYIKNNTPFALRSKSYSSGKGFDGDVTAGFKKKGDRGGSQTLEIECKMHLGQRNPQFNV